MVKQTSMQGAKLLMTIALMTHVAGCGSKSKSSIDGGTQPADLVGTWQSTCIAGTATSEKKQIKFGLETFDYTSISYADTTCTSVTDTIEGSGTYKLDGTTAKDKVGTLDNIDYTFTSYTWTFTSAPLTAVDYAKACSSTETNGKVDILGKTCVLDSSNTIVFASPAYGTLLLEDPKIVVTDLNTNGATTATRSTDIVNSKNVAWTKDPTTAAQ